MTRLTQQAKAVLVGAEFRVNLVIGGHGHIDLATVLENALLVLLVDRGRGWAVELGPVLATQLSVLSLLSIDNLLASGDHIKVDLS